MSKPVCVNKVEVVADVLCTEREAYPLPGRKPAPPVTVKLDRGQVLDARWRRGGVMVTVRPTDAGEVVDIFLPADVRPDAQPYAVILDSVPAASIAYS